MMKKLIRAAFLTASLGICAQAQIATPTPEPLAPVAPPVEVTLETILGEAEKQVAVYQETFKDLLAIETKTFEEYDKNGELEDKTSVESNFFVYQSVRSENVSSELRNVTKVDDRLVPESQSRADRFLAELQKAKTVEKELEKLQDEGLRYDKTYKISGLTLFEAIVLADNLRPLFNFKLLGTENYQGREVYVVSYRQTKKSPFITVNEKGSKEKGVKAYFDADIPGALKKNERFLRGKLMIDTETFQLWREERSLAIETAQPIIAQETIFEYAASEFGILVPKRITFIENGIRRNSKSEDFRTVKNTQVIFDYSKFRKTNVDVQIIDEP